jgi:hypothetical protein
MTATDQQQQQTVTMGEEDLTDVEVSYFDALDALYFEELAKRSETKEQEDEGGANNRLHERGGTKPSLRQIRGHVDARQKKLRESIRRRRKKMLQIMSNPKTIMLRDKVSFVLGVLLIMVIEFVLLVHPAKMGLLYTSLLLPLMTARYIICKSFCPFLVHSMMCLLHTTHTLVRSHMHNKTDRADLYHYFMYDFCYFAQVMQCIQMHKYPDDIRLASKFNCLSILFRVFRKHYLMLQNCMIFIRGNVRHCQWSASSGDCNVEEFISLPFSR